MATRFPTATITRFNSGRDAAREGSLPDEADPSFDLSLCPTPGDRPAEEGMGTSSCLASR